MPDTTGTPRFLLGTVAHNQHVMNIARALYEVDALGAFYTGGVDWFRSPAGRTLRKLASRLYPRLDSLMSRRQIPDLPSKLVFPNWRWESPRLAARYLGLGAGMVDRVWELGELALDRNCARLLRNDRFCAYFGVEHGALSSIQAARAIGKKSVVGFLSPHHSTRAEWVDREYERFPELLTSDTRRIRERAKARDARRDEEARTADVVHCASTFTARSLIRAGLTTPDKLTIVPLGCPTPVNHASSAKGGRMRFISSGTVALHKGTHILLDAWRRIRPGHSAELHIYGAITLPRNFLGVLDGSVILHGPVSLAEMSQAYSDAAVLVFPTLCDGFGMVVAEAFSHSLPVITTPNAGAADLVREGSNGFLVPPRDVDRLAAQMEWCIDHPEDVETMRSRARETALGWQWSDFRDLFKVQLNQRLVLPASSLEERASNLHGFAEARMVPENQ